MITGADEKVRMIYDETIDKAIIRIKDKAEENLRQKALEAGNQFDNAGFTEGFNNISYICFYPEKMDMTKIKGNLLPMVKDNLTRIAGELNFTNDIINIRLANPRKSPAENLYGLKL